MPKKSGCGSWLYALAGGVLFWVILALVFLITIQLKPIIHWLFGG